MHLKTETTRHATEAKAFTNLCKHGETAKQYAMDSPWPCMPIPRLNATTGHKGPTTTTREFLTIGIIQAFSSPTHRFFPLKKLSSNNSHVQQSRLVPFAKSGKEHSSFTKRMDKDRCSLAGSMTDTYV